MDGVKARITHSPYQVARWVTPASATSRSTGPPTIAWPPVFLLGFVAAGADHRQARRHGGRLTQHLEQGKTLAAIEAGVRDKPLEDRSGGEPGRDGVEGTQLLGVGRGVRLIGAREVGEEPVDAQRGGLSPV